MIGVEKLGSLRCGFKTVQLSALFLRVERQEFHLPANQHSTTPGTPECRIFKVRAGSEVHISDLTIMDGLADRGAGILNAGTLVIDRCTLSSNIAHSQGGGIFNEGEVVMSCCTLSDNSADTFGEGGGIYNESGGDLSITNSTLSGNYADANGGGIYNYNSSPIMTNCTLHANSANNAGGGNYSNNSSPITTNCKLDANSATDGGAIYNDNSPAVISNCTLFGNTGYSAGGGIYNYNSSPTISNCILWADTAPTGTEIYDVAKRNGWIEDENYAHYDMAHAIMPTETLSRQEVQEELWRCYQAFYGSYKRNIAGIFSKNKLKRTLYRHMAGQHVLSKLRRLI